MNELRRIAARGRPYRGRFLVGLACAAVTSLFATVTTEFAARVADLFQRASELEAAGELSRRLLLFALAVPALVLLKGAFDYSCHYLIASSAQGVLADLRADLYANLVERPIGYLSRTPTGEFVSRVTSDVQRLEFGLTLRLTDLLIEVPSVVILSIYLVVQNWRLALVTLLLVPLASPLVRRWARRLKAASRQAQEQTASLSATLNETLGGIRVVKAYLAEKQETLRFLAINERLRRTNLRSTRTLAASSPVMDVLGAVPIVLLIVAATHEIVARRIDPGEAIAFFAGITFLYRSVKKATTANNELQNTIAAASRCFQILDEGAKEPEGGLEVSGLREGIEFRGVGFGYGETEVLSDFDLRAARGDVVALVGESGSGKTTVVNLLVRFFDPQRGSITWDGVDLREISPKSIRAQVALVTQDTVVFDDTVARNIAYGDPHPDRERVEAAARAAHAHAFVMELPQGYDTTLGERGNRLSGGQRQRIAIARALYKDAPVLVLDEATSSLDSQTEALFQEALARLLRDRTVLVVAHRLATVREADRIVVLSEGRIVQQGSHQDLLRQDGTYRQLHQLQSGRG